MLGLGLVEMVMLAGAIPSCLYAVHRYMDFLLGKHATRVRTLVREELSTELQPIKDATLKQREFEAKTTLQLTRLNLGFDNLTTDVAQLKGWTAGYSAASGSRPPVWKDDLEGGSHSA